MFHDTQCPCCDQVSLSSFQLISAQLDLFHIYLYLTTVLSCVFQKLPSGLSRLHQCPLPPLPSLMLSPRPKLSPSAALSPRSQNLLSPRPNNLKCSICGKVFTTSTGYKAHVDSHNGIYQYNCSYCQKGFTGKLALLEHTTSHTNINNFPCRVCEQTFRYAYRLKIHMRAEHAAPPTPQRPSPRPGGSAPTSSPTAAVS